MPGRDGIELARRLVAAGHAQAFLFISGYCDLDAIPNRTRDFPESAFLSKPFSIPQLLEAFRGLLQERTTQRQTASVREQSRGMALRRPARPAPIEVVRALSRKTGRLRAQRDRLVEDARWGLHAQSVLLAQIEAQFAAIQLIQRNRPTRRAML